MDNPYREQPPTAFWKLAVSEKNPFDLKSLYSKKFPIERTDLIASAGSCFAQHIGRHLKSVGYRYLDTEPAPHLLSHEKRTSFGYDMYSARYGNIYTARQLKQLVSRAFGEFKPVDQDWEQDGRFFDAFRPTIEPNGFGSLEELTTLREHHLKSVRELVTNADIFIFTFGLTEAWISKVDGAAYPLCPGTAVGQFDPEKYEFKNFTCSEIVADMAHVIEQISDLNKDVRFIFTVSPVPLVATATSDHVLIATSYSKSVLRAAAGELAMRPNVAYFPSYEIISTHPMRGIFFQPNLREVNNAGVNHVMTHFFEQHPPPKVNSDSEPINVCGRDEDDDEDAFVACDEILLEAEAPH
jgi:GSCFA family protein